MLTVEKKDAEEPLLGKGSKSSELEGSPVAEMEPAGPSTQSTSSTKTPRAPRIQHHSLSFFDDYDVIDGTVVSIINTGNENEAHPISHSYSKTGSKLLIGRTNGTVHVFDIRAQKSVEEITVSDDPIHACQFKGDADDVIICVDGNGFLSRWQRKEDGNWTSVMKAQCSIGSEGTNKKFEISADGKYLLGACWTPHVSTHQEQIEREEAGDDGKPLLCEFHLGWYDIGTTLDYIQELKKIDVKTLNDVCVPIFSPNSKGCLITGAIGSVVLPDYNMANPTFNLDGDVGYWTEDGKVVMYDTGRDVSSIWDVASVVGVHKFLRAELKPALLVKDNVMHYDGKRMFVRKGDRGVCFDISVFNTANNTIVGQLKIEEDAAWPNHEDGIYYLSDHSKDGKWLATCAGGIVTVWNREYLYPILETTVPDEPFDKLNRRLLKFTSKGDKLMLISGSRCVVYDLNGFHGLHAFACDIPAERDFDKWVISNDGRVLASVMHEREKPAYLSVWNVDKNRHFKLTWSTETYEVEDFCLSFLGDRAAVRIEHPTNKTNSIAVWNLEGGDGVHAQAVYPTLVGDFKLAEHMFIRGMSFTVDDQGRDLIVLLTGFADKGRFEFIWYDLNGVVAERQAWEAQCLNLKHRFSVDGSTCVILYIAKPTVVEVWDMRGQRKVRTINDPDDSPLVGLKSPEALLDAFVDVDFAQQLSMDGGQLVLGVNKFSEPWMFAGKDTLAFVEYRGADGAPYSEFGKSNLAGSIAAVSEDGAYVAICLNYAKSKFRITVQAVGEGGGGSQGSTKEIEFQSDLPPGNVSLLLSGNGQRVAWVTEERVVVWDLFCDERCIPSYRKLKLGNFTNKLDTVTGLLEKHGKNVLNYPDADGWSLLSNAVAHRNTEWVKAMLAWAENSQVPVVLTMQQGLPREGSAPMNMLRKAIETFYPEGAQILIQSMLNGTLVSIYIAEIWADAMRNMIDNFPTIFKEFIADPGMLHANGEVKVPYYLFENRSFYVCTNNEQKPEDLRKLWSKKVELHVERNPIWRLLTGMVCWGGRRIFNDKTFQIPAVSYVIPVEGFAAVGSEGILQQVLMKGIGSEVFNSMPLRSVVQYKWDAYGAELLSKDLFLFILLLAAFTIYSLLLAYGCTFDKRSGDLTKGFELASGITLGVSMVLALRGLYGELKQYIAFCTGRLGFGYYFYSKWNIVEFATYCLLLVAIPFFHFKAHPCNVDWGVTWAVPVASIMLWWKILYYAQAFRSTGPMVLMIFAIMQDIMFFLFIGACILFGFGVAFFVLYRGDADHKDDFGSIERSLVSMFAIMLGAFELSTFYESKRLPPLTIVLFFVYVMVMVVVLLNLLIAIMGDSFDRIKSAEKENFIMVRASIIDDVESMLSYGRHRRISRKIGSFVHILRPKDQVEEYEEWPGKIIQMERRIKGVVDRSRAELHSDFKRLVESIKNELGTAIREKTEDLEGKISNLASLLEASQEQKLEKSRSRKK